MSEANIPANKPNAANHARRSVGGAILALAGAVIMATGLHPIVTGLGGIVAAVGLGSWAWHTYRRDTAARMKDAVGLGTFNSRFANHFGHDKPYRSK